MVRATSSRPSGGGPRVPAAWTSPAWMVLWLLSIAALVTFARWDGIPFYLVWLGFMLICGLVMVWHAYLGRSVDAERARANEENGRLLAIQRRFLQDASHQLKTPITIALGHAELLARELAGRGEQRDIDVVVGELTRLKSLSERLLAIAASQDPEFLSPEPVPLALTGALRALDKQRASVDAALEHAITTLSAHAAPPTLPG